MAVQFIDLRATYALAAGSLSMSVPAVEVGDITLVAVCRYGSTAAVNTPAGWTKLAETSAHVDPYSGVGQYHLFYQRATVARGVTVLSWSGDTTDWGGCAVTYRGVATVNPFPSVAEDQGTRAGYGTAPALDVYASGLTRLAFMGVVPGSQTYDWNNVPSGWTLRAGMGNYMSQAYEADAYTDAAEDFQFYVDKTNPLDWHAFSVALSGNSAPNAPTLVSPAGGAFINPAATQRFTWEFSDPDLNDSQSAARVYYREVGAPTWTQVDLETPNWYWDAPAGTFASDTDYEWQVETADAVGNWGARSVSEFFTAAVPPNAPTITDPINGQTIGLATYTGTISASSLEVSEWTLYADDGAGGIDTGTVLQGPVTKTTGNLRAHTWTGLENGSVVWWSVRIKDGGLWSLPAQIRTPVSYTPPPAPTFTLAADNANGSLGISINNPAPSGSEPAASYNDVFVDDGAGEFRLATNVAPNGSVTYWLPRALRDYSGATRVRAYAENGVYADS